MSASRVLRNSLEPDALIECFVKHPPEGFEILRDSPLLAFVAPFDLLTTADDVLKERLRGLPGYARWSRWLSLRANFIGTTVSEYALIPVDVEPAAMVRALGQGLGRRRGLTIIKDLPHDSPLLDETENAHADAFARACETRGWVVVEGQALAYVPIDFSDGAAYVRRLPKSARRYLTRKLRARDQVKVEKIATGTAFSDDARIDSYYALYEEVYGQSSIHFDRLTRPFFAALLRDEAAQGIVFEYRHCETDELLGWNLCFDDGTRLVDKYIGLSYPGSRQVNLYFISWMVNLEYALQRGLTHYVAGWTDPGVKAMLGAKFTATRHAVYVRNPVLRMLARSFRKHFTADKKWLP